MSSDITRPARLVSRSISAENLDGAKGGGGRATTGHAERAASRLGPGWKISPCIDIAPGETAQIADIAGPGMIQHIWMTTDQTHWRELVLRIYWDGDDVPAVEVPYGDFFCNGWNEFAQVSSQMVAANPYGGFNSYWQMPFARHARITLENVGYGTANVYYQVSYGVGEIPSDSLYFHAQWRRSNPVTGGIHPILDGVQGLGRYAGVYLAWQSNSPGWWGEGELKVFLDGDDEFPTICGTGVEDYFGGAWAFIRPQGGYEEFTTPYLGFHQVVRPDGIFRSQQRFGMYRWHVVDSIAFSSDIRVTIQALGLGPGQGNGREHRFRTLADDVASTAFFYLDRPALPDDARPRIPDVLELEVD